MNNSRRGKVAAAWLVALAAVAPAATQAATFTVSGEITFADPGLRLIDAYDVTSPVSVGREVHHEALGTRDFHAQADSLAEEGGLHAHAYSQIIHQVSGESGGGAYTAHAFAMSSFNDFVVNGPIGAPPIDTSLNFHLSGQMSLGTYHAIFGSWPSVSAGVNFSVQVDGASGSGDGGSYGLSYSNGIASAPNASGMLVGFNGSMDLKTRVFTLPVNVPIPIALYLDTVAQVQVDFADAFVTSANTDFGSTLTFATDRPVFDLPAGYTVNSVEAGIVNNVFTPAVPEPGSAGLLALGLAGLSLLRARARA